MSGVKLAPIKGFPASTKVELEPLASLLTSFEQSPLSDSSSIPLLPPVPFSINQYETHPVRKKRSFFRNDINQLWGTYLKQQQDVGDKHFLNMCHKKNIIKVQILKIVDISNKQAMAKSYHRLDEKELNILRKIGKAESDDNLIKKCVPVSAKVTIGLRKRLHNKPVNRRQKRKKMIRDELKRQLRVLFLFGSGTNNNDCRHFYYSS